MNERIILASGSPRRRELLELICPAFDVVPSGADETLCADETPLCAVLRLSEAKAADVLAKTEGPRCVIGSDTMVVLEGEAMGKPRDAEDARRMLRALSGKTHEVLTGVSIQTHDGYTDTALSRTLVTFYELTEREIEDYVATGEPMDKAGAYGIQGRGAQLARGIKGDFYGVMGLPVAVLARMLRAGGIL